MPFTEDLFKDQARTHPQGEIIQPNQAVDI